MPRPYETPVELRIGLFVHCKWANRECVWKICAIDGDRITLRTPKSGKEIKAWRSELQLARREELKAP